MVFSLIFAGLLGFSVVSGYVLFSLYSDQGSLVHIDGKNPEQTRQLALLSEKVLLLDQEMSELRGYNRHLSQIAKLDLLAPEEMVGLGGGGADSFGSGLTSELLTEKILTRRLHSHIKQLGDDISVEKEVSREILAQIERERSLMAHTPSIWPTRGWITSRYGWRASPFTSQREFHKGIDIAGRKDTPVVAPADGIVTAYYNYGGFGNFLVLNHGFGIVTRYAHLSWADVEVGQMVKRGEKIANIGNTGRSTGTHLHYEVLVNGNHVNPQRY
ncbi:MAG: M23 family metallopeptidase, partial [Desulfomonilia bacterium]|nr:M23 family metallopeptidase [Desulfomonilia bacterium]